LQALSREAFTGICFPAAATRRNVCPTTHGNWLKGPAPAGNYSVRFLLVLLLILIATAWVACALEPEHFGVKQQPFAVKPWGWRRAAHGWEKSEDWWRSPAGQARSLGARLSPFSVAAFEIAVSLTVLLMWDRRDSERGKQR
jgi:hypothetical protein